MMNMMKKNNKILTEILKKGFFVGLDFQNDYLFIEYMTSLYIINPKNLLMEFFLYNFFLVIVTNIFKQFLSNQISHLKILFYLLKIIFKKRKKKLKQLKIIMTI